MSGSRTVRVSDHEQQAEGRGEIVGGKRFSCRANGLHPFEIRETYLDALSATYSLQLKFDVQFVCFQDRLQPPAYDRQGGGIALPALHALDPLHHGGRVILVE